MRILVVSTHFWPENFRVNDLVAELVARGHQVTVLTGLPNYPGGRVFPEYAAAPGKFSHYAGAAIVRAPVVSRGDGGWRLLLNYASFVISASIVGIWRLRRQDIDLIFVFESSPITVGIPAALLRSIKRAPMVFWVLDLWPDTLQAIGVVRSRWGLRLVGALVRWIYARCDLILAQSRGFMPKIAAYCAAGKRIRYFPNWAEPLFAGARAIPAPEVPPWHEGFTVLFAGNVGDAQDFPAIVRAAELLREDRRVRWLIVGDGSMAQWLQQQLRLRGLEHCVLMPGMFPVERMPAFFAHADALLVALKKEPIFAMTIPGKLQAYLAAGIPILAMLDGEGASVVKVADAGLTCPAGDAPALAAAVRAMAAMDHGQLRAMGERGRAAAEGEFNRGRLIGQLEAWFDQLRAGAPVPDEPDAQ